MSNSPLISWQFKLFGPYIGSDLIGLTEIIAAALITAGYVRPKAGIVGGLIASVMFFTTSTMVITTPGTLVAVHGMRYMTFLGLFLFKDVIALGVSTYLISYFGQRAVLSEKPVLKSKRSRNKWSFKDSRKFTISSSSVAAPDSKLLAWTFAGQGQRVAAVERKYVGGACPNIACLPSKNIIHTAQVAHDVWRSEEFGISIDSFHVNMPAVRIENAGWSRGSSTRISLSTSKAELS